MLDSLGMPSKIEDIAETYAEAVRMAFVKTYGLPEDRSVIRRSIIPTWSQKGVDLGWSDPHPGHVLVLTEFAWVQDMWSSNEDHLLWEKTAAILNNEGWDHTWFDSINSGVQIVYWDWPREWSRIIMKRKGGPFL